MPPNPPRGPHEKDDLERNIERVVGALASGVGKGIALAAEAFEQHEAERKKTRERKQYERDLSKAELRRAKVDAKMAGTSRLEGVFLTAAATAALVFTGMNPELWFVGIPAFFTMLHGVRVLGWHAERKLLDRQIASEQAPAGPVATKAPAIPRTVAADPREQAINDRCDKLLNALKDSSDAVRAFLPKPDETVTGLRKASLDVLRRERTLRELANPEETRKLDRERDALLERIGRERDEGTRNGLESALAALDQRREQQAALLRHANRMEAEGLRLGYVIDGLYAQVQRVKAVGSGAGTPAVDALRTQVDLLRDEMSALADAVEQANAETLVTLDPADTVAPGDAPDDVRSPARSRTR